MWFLGWKSFKKQSADICEERRKCHGRTGTDEKKEHQKSIQRDVLWRGRELQS